MIQDNCSNCKHRGNNNVCTAHNMITPDDAWCIGHWPVEERSESKHCAEVAKEFYKGLKAGLEEEDGILLFSPELIKMADILQREHIMTAEELKNKLGISE